jgi:hypothetical protein
MVDRKERDGFEWQQTATTGSNGMDVMGIGPYIAGRLLVGYDRKCRY